MITTAPPPVHLQLRMACCGFLYLCSTLLVKLSIALWGLMTKRVSSVGLTLIRWSGAMNLASLSLCAISCRQAWCRLLPLLWASAYLKRASYPPQKKRGGEKWPFQNWRPFFVQAVFFFRNDSHFYGCEIRSVFRQTFYSPKRSSRKKKLTGKWQND